MPKITYGTSHVPLSPAVRAGDYLHISGQVPVVDGKLVGSTIQEQTTQCLKNLEATLKLADAELSDVIKCFVILTDLSEFSGFNEAYSKVFTKDPPARTTVGAKLAGEFRIEIEAVAYKPLK